MTITKANKIFISYNHRDKEFVRRLDGDLRSRGLLVFLDERDIKVGQSIIQRLSTEIEASSHLIAVLSTNSIASSWVQRELSSALMLQLSDDRGITILPLVLDNCDVPLLLRGIKWANFREGYESGLEQILQVVGGSGYIWKRAEAEEMIQEARDAARVKDYEEAGRKFENVLKWYGPYPAAYSGLANVRFHQRRYQEGINCANKAIHIDPNFPYSYYQRGLCRRASGNIDGAKSDFKRALELKPDFDYARNQLYELLKLGF
jgi:tetratricopeptide (TPR) repeat protein